MFITKKNLASLLFVTLLMTACGSEGSINVIETKDVGKTPGKVWEQIGAFNDLGRWHPAVAKTRMSEDGSIRTLFLNGGGEINERLIDYNDGVSYKYEIIDGVLPVMNYVSTIAVEPTENGSRVTWESNFDPKDGTTAKKAEEVIRSVYRGGLDKLR